MCVNEYEWYEYLHFECVILLNRAPNQSHIGNNDCLASSIDTISMSFIVLIEKRYIDIPCYVLLSLIVLVVAVHVLFHSAVNMADMRFPSIN